MKKVYIVGGRQGNYARLFSEAGFGITDDPQEADLLCFTGGEDVNPALYGEARHPTTWCNQHRDAYEAVAFREYIDKPKVGICRGGQFLNVQCGGRMYQDVDRHTRPHPIFHPDGGKAICIATSTHHQMMIPGPEGEVLAVANESTRREHCGATRYGHNPEVFVTQGAHDDTEVVYYNVEKALCFQPHPELPYATNELKEYFFGLIKDKLGVSPE